MKNIKITGSLIIVLVTALVACNDKRSPGRIYMPDMAYSRAYEAQSPNALRDSGINYVPIPVSGTMRRGDLAPYAITNDTAGYEQSGAVQSQIAALDSNGLLEAKRLYNINCGICHGPNMDAQGPLAVSGKVGGIANLKAGANLTLPIGRIFHVMTYGKGLMGSYASQLDRTQRWMVAQYVKSEQAKSTGGATTGTDSTATKPAGAAVDTATVAKK